MGIWEVQVDPKPKTWQESDVRSGLRAFRSNALGLAFSGLRFSSGLRVLGFRGAGFSALDYSTLFGVGSWEECKCCQERHRGSHVLCLGLVRLGYAIIVYHSETNYNSTRREGNKR